MNVLSASDKAHFPHAESRARGFTRLAGQEGRVRPGRPDLYLLQWAIGWGFGELRGPKLVAPRTRTSVQREGVVGGLMAGHMGRGLLSLSLSAHLTARCGRPAQGKTTG
ncbi:unnamed protein product [Pleuronectes platessa]|uniref:Uncharacterized protein n=1 Tax=Pleuronectes platessa TaxID=8262 RepID=A0A9N7UNF6_PLEPL|nr:unnamed protein product [Pleuronectes platessa]